uniref:Putative ionotropic receptor 1 n=1 Tax=Conopomorpha sinensis TaxID=940481 RepID=A0A3Q8HG95_9NEOP|nr:putative ionotropic receptor 1 [Conopomorpha sinensis]
MFSGKLILFLALHLIPNAKCENPLLMTSGNSAEIAEVAECVLKLSAKYFVEKKALSGSIVIININSYASTTQMLLLQTIHGGIKYSVMVKDSFYRHANASHFPEKAKNYMLILEEQSELTRNILQLNKLPTWNPLAKAVVYYQLKDGENGEKISMDFINELRHFKLLKTIIFIYSSVDKAVMAYTWQPYSDTNCGGSCTSVYILDSCTKTGLKELEKQREMFPLDMKGCPLVTHAIISEPYVLPPERKIDDGIYDNLYEFKGGSEINLMRIICQFTNMSLKILLSEKPENWGVVHTNGKASGAFAILRNDSVDMVVGNIEVTRPIRKWFDPTVSYIQDEITWCLPKAGQASTWNNLVIIFHWTTWVATFASLVIMGLMLHVFFYKESGGKVTKWPTNSLLMTFSMLLGWGAQFEPKSATFRILIFSWLYFGIIMGISYESLLRSFLMYPRFEKQISSERELIESGLPLGGREIYRPYFENNNASSFYLYRKYNSTTFAEGIRRAAFENFAVVASRRQAVYMDQKLGKGAPLLYCFPESNNLYKYGVVLLARKWFPMLERLNNIIRSVSENGLIEKWNEELFIHSVGGDETSVIEPLGSQHLLGAFMFIGFMYAASVLVFIGELSCGFMEKRRRKTWTHVCYK